MLQRPVVSIEVPVPRPRGGPELVLSMHPGANSLDQVIRRQQPAPGWIVAVIDRAGVRVARTPDPERFVGQPVTPEDLGTAGPFDSLQGAPVTASGSGEEFVVNDNSNVVCGNVQTANATVYIVDTVLMPPAA